MSEVDSPASDSRRLIVRLRIVRCRTLPPVGQPAEYRSADGHVSDSVVVGTFPGRDITRGTGLLGRTVIVTVIIYVFLAQVHSLGMFLYTFGCYVM